MGTYPVRPNLVTSERSWPPMARRSQGVVGGFGGTYHGTQHETGRTPKGHSPSSEVVARAGIEPATFHFSGGRSYRLSYLAQTRDRTHILEIRETGPGRRLATLTGLEPATSAVTGRRANQLRYRA